MPKYVSYKGVNIMSLEELQCSKHLIGFHSFAFVFL